MDKKSIPGNGAFIVRCPNCGAQRKASSTHGSGKCPMCKIFGSWTTGIKIKK